MAPVSLQQFRAAARSLDGHSLVTQARQQAFRLRVETWGLEFTPESSGEPRREAWKQVAGVLDRFNESGAWLPGRYQDITRNASYLLAVLRGVSEPR